MLLALKTRNVIGAFRSVTVKQSSIVSQIVSSPVALSLISSTSPLYSASNCWLRGFSSLS